MTVQRKVKAMASIFRGKVAARSLGTIISIAVLLVVVSLIMVPSIFLGATAAVSAASNAPIADVWGVKSVDATHFWGVAGTRFDSTFTSYGVVVFYDGNNVVEQYRYDPGTGNNGVLYGVDAVSASDVWAVGGWNMAGNGGVILHSDGTNWTVAEQNQPNLMQVSVGEDANHVWAVGYSGPFDAPTGKILFFDGTNWAEVHSEPGFNISTIYALNNTHMWAFAGSPSGGEGKMLFSADGLTWSNQQTIPADTGLYSIRGTGTDNLWASTTAGPQRPEGIGGVYKFDSGTNSWSQVYTRDQWLEGLYVADPNHVWATGEFGTIVFYNGSSWSVLAGGVDGGGDVNLHGADGYDASHVWTSGQTDNEELPTIAFIAPTPAGSDVGVQMPALLSGTDVSMNFNQVTSPGSSTAIPQLDPAVKFQVVGGTCMEVQTSATYTGKIEVSVAYDPATLTMPVSSLRLMHKQGGTWIDATKSVDSVNHLVTGEVDSLSPFVLGATAFYFAEGTCRPNFDPYICIQNPGATDADVTITYMKGDGTTATDQLTVIKNSRSTVLPRTKLGTGNDAAHDFSAKVECTNGQQIIAERPMYFNYNGVWMGGHDVVGATGPATAFYFAEGTCRPNFDPYICIQNPGATDADVTITYMKGDGTTATDQLTVIKNSRSTVLPRTKLGTGNDAAHDFSAKVECTNGQQIIAERPMYFNYNGVWMGGHDVVGATGPATAFYFAEGTCRPNFDPYICIQNPGATDADVTITYMKGDGTTATDQLTVIKNSRSTVLPRTKLGTGNDAAHDFSAKVECTNGQQIIAERPMYFNYNGVWMGGHDVVGATGPATAFYFAEGTCRPNFDPYVCIQNPGATDADVTITYMKGDGTTATDQLTVIKNSRSTVLPRTKLGTGNDAAHDFSAKVECTNGQQIITERPMYFNYNGVWMGGHDVVGFTP